MALDVGDLAARGLVAPERLDELRRVAENFAVALTDEVAALIDPADPADPIAAQFVPRADELKVSPEESRDPIGDERWSPAPGIVHRYPDRVLLKPILVCPVYCRFCFRREQVGKAGALSAAELERALGYVRERPAAGFRGPAGPPSRGGSRSGNRPGRHGSASAARDRDSDGRCL